MRSFKLLFISLFACLALLSLTLLAQEKPFEFWPGGTYDSSVPTPESMLGYQLGEHFSYYHEMVDYIKELEKSSARVKVFQYGTSFERRKLYYLVISSPDNMAKMEAYRTITFNLFVSV